MTTGQAIETLEKWLKCYGHWMNPVFRDMAAMRKVIELAKHPTVTAEELQELGFTPGRSGINWTHGIYLSVTLYQDGVLDVRVEDVPLYGVKTRADVENLIRLLGEPRQ